MSEEILFLFFLWLMLMFYLTVVLRRISEKLKEAGDERK